MKNKIEYEAELLKDGHISCPCEVVQTLGLREGDKLKVALMKITGKYQNSNYKKNISLRASKALKEVESGKAVLFIPIIVLAEIVLFQKRKI